MPSITYEALPAAGAPGDQARGAAEETAAHEGRFAKIERDLAILKWMIAGLYAFGAPSLWLLVRVAAKAGEPG